MRNSERQEGNMSQSTTPPLDPLLIPVYLGDGGPQPKRKLAAVSVIAKTAARHGKNTRRNRKPTQPTKYTIADAFNYFCGPTEERGGSEFQNERCVRSVAYLLEYLSNHGNSDVAGTEVSGLGGVLAFCADAMARAIAHREWLREHGGKS
jgi:hypothetical protein